MKKFSAIIFMLAASFFFACATVLAKGLGQSNIGEGVHPFQIAYARFFFSFIFLIIIWFFLDRFEIKSSNIHIHILRSTLGWAGVTILFTAILYIPISDATALTFLNPIFAMIFAVIFFREKVELVRWFAAVVSLLGGLILIRPTLNFNVDPIALLCLFGAMIMGLEIICIKVLSNKEEVFKILLFNNFFAMCIGSFFLPFFLMPVSILEFIVLTVIAFFMVTGQFCFINSLKKADTSFLMPFFYTTLIFVILFDFIFFDSMPDKISYFGASIIIFGSLVVSFKELHTNEKNIPDEGS